MLRVLGSAKRLCDGWTRRELLRAGGLSLFSLGLGDFWRLREAEASPVSGTLGADFGKAKSCILLYLYGAPSQLELYDLKPQAPVEIRGQFKPIATTVPGLQICEYLPRMAKIMDRTTVVRSMTHPYNIHSAAYTLTGVPHVDIPMELNPYDSRHWPFLGSVLDYLEGRTDPSAAPPAVPRNVAMPFQFSSRSGEYDRGGPYGGFLGQAYNPVWTEFEGEATKRVARWSGNRDNPVRDPHAGITPESRFLISPAAQVRGELTLDRLHRRRNLLKQFDRQRRRALGTSKAVRSHDRFQEMAFSLITSSEVRTALDIHHEGRRLRDEYGMTLFGQAVLAARRLVEAGCRLVTVFWDEYGTANSAWDTHFNHFTRLKDELLPGLDQAFSALILDLESRGMLEETLVVCISEHGRTPKISNSKGGGREHWSRAYSGLFAGGGIKPGNVVGESDKHAADVKDRPLSPKDILCTIYHLMGVDAKTVIHDTLDRPQPLVAEGEVVEEMLG